MKTIILIQLLLAHFFTDFVFQRQKMVKSKNSEGLKSPYYWGHIVLSGTLTYLILMQWTNWLVPAFIIITHGIIDYWKINKEKQVAAHNASHQKRKDKKTGTVYFFLDQLFHLLAIIIAWLYLTNCFREVWPFIESLLTDKKYITIITALILVIWPIGVAIGKMTEPFQKEFKQKGSLKRAGMYIGIFERLLVLIFILMGQYEAIGFLIAAKSVLRISKDNDKNARKKTEYVLVGTLISFTVAIIIGLVTQYLISN